MANPTLHRPLEDYIVALENLTPRSLPLLGKMLTPDLRLITPLCDVSGADAALDVAARFFLLLGRIKIRVTDAGWGRDDHTALLRWTAALEGGGVIEGMSELTLRADGRIAAQRDFWDSAAIQVKPRSRWHRWWNRA